VDFHGRWPQPQSRHHQFRALVDYVHGAIWVTSRSNGGTSQPSLWKLNPNTGVVLFSAKLGPIDYSPTLSPQSDVLFVSVNGGALTAIDPVTGSTLGSINPGDGGVKNSRRGHGFMPYTVVLTTNSQVWSYQFSCLTNPAVPPQELRECSSAWQASDWSDKKTGKTTLASL